MKPIVAIKKCDTYEPETVYAAVKNAVDLAGGMGRFTSPGERILIKPNILAGKGADKGVTTHPSVLRAAVMLVLETGAEPVVGDSSALGSTTKNAEAAGLLDVCTETGVRFVELKTMVRVKNPGGRVFKSLEVSKEALDADGIINLPKFKTHAQMHLTLAVKNLFGCVPGKRKAQWHLSAGVDTRTFAAMLLDLHAFLSPRLSIMDAVMAMEGNGPASGELTKLGLIIAGENATAIDRVSAEIVGVDPRAVPVLREARRAEFKGARLGDIRLTGEPVSSVKADGFKLPPRVMDINFSAFLPYFAAKKIRHALTSRPHVETKKCTLCNICASLCPAESMERKTRIVIDYDSCIRCYCCQESCPRGAISAREGWLKRVVPGL